MDTRNRTTRGRAAVALTGTGGLLVTMGLVGLAPSTATASSHREAPLISALPQYDTTDVYAFRSPDRPGTVTLIANWLPFEEPGGGPNFYSFATDARYNIKVDNNGDGSPDVTLRWTFKDHYRNGNTFLYNTGPVTSLRDRDLNYYQTYTLEKVVKGRARTLVRNARVVPSNVGAASMPNYPALRSQGVTPAGRHGKITSFAGQAEDPFFLDLRVFDLLYGGDLSEVGDDTLAGFNVNSVALQVPRSMLARKGDVARNPVVGIWSTTGRKGVNGKYTQVSRLGNPLVNEVVIPVKDKDDFNASLPVDDAQFGAYVTDPELPRLIEAVYGIDAPATPRNDLVSVFLTGVAGLNQPPARSLVPSEQLRLNLSTPVTAEPDRLGVIAGDNQGFPNGRRLADDVIDIALQVVEGELVGAPNDLGDGVDANDKAFGNRFPYLGLPVSGSNANPHPGGGAARASDDADGALGAWLSKPEVSGTALGLGVVALVVGSVGMLRRRVLPASAGVPATS